MSRNIGIIAPSAVSGIDIRSWGTIQVHPLGTLGMLRDGRLFRYCQSGGADLVPGNLIQKAAVTTAHLANTPPAVAIGATSFTYAPGAATGAANLYAEGYLNVDTAPGNGYAYNVSGHAAIGSSTAFTLNLDPDDPIVVALTTSSRVGLHTHLYKNVIATPTTAITGPVVGGSVSAIPTTQYGWIQTRGPFSALIDGTPAVTSQLLSGVTTAGAVRVWDATGAITANPVGVMMQIGVDTKNNMIFLTID